MTTVHQSTALIELKKELAAKAGALNQVFEESGMDRDFNKVKCLGSGLNVTAKIEKVRQMNDEMGDLHAKIKDLEEFEGIATQAQAQWQAMNEPINPITHPSGDEGQRGQRQVKSIGRLFVDSSEYQSQRNRMQWKDPVDLPNADIRNAVVRTGAGWDPQVIRLDRVELDPPAAHRGDRQHPDAAHWHGHDFLHGGDHLHQQRGGDRRIDGHDRRRPDR